MSDLPSPALPTRNIVAQVSLSNQQMIRWFEDVTTVAQRGVPDGDKGDITVSNFGSLWTVDPGAITLEKMADLPAGTIIGNDLGVDGVPRALSAVDAKALLGLAAIATSGQADDLFGSKTAAFISDFAEAVDDRVAALAVAGANMTIVYDDTAGTLTFASTGGGGGGGGSFDLDDGTATLDGVFEFEEGGA